MSYTRIINCPLKFSLNVLLLLVLAGGPGLKALAKPYSCAVAKGGQVDSSVNSNFNTLSSQASNLAAEDRAKLENGEVIIGLREIDGIKYVSGRIMINASPDKVWPVMVNPFEFQKKISPRMSNVDVLVDKEAESILKVTLDVPFPLPKVTYIVKSNYEKDKSVKFRRIGGLIKDFRGTWEMLPACNGTKTDLIYCMYIDPGFPVPQFIVREGVKMELPSTLIGLRNRVVSLTNTNNLPVKHTILAALNNSRQVIH